MRPCESGASRYPLFDKTPVDSHPGRNSHRLSLSLALIAVIAIAASGFVLIRSTGTVHAQDLSNVITFAEAQAVAARCYNANTVPVKLPDGTVTERKILPHDFNTVNNRTAIDCSWEEVNKNSGNAKVIAVAHIWEAWGDIYMQEGRREVAGRLFLNASVNLQIAIYRLPTTIEGSALRLDLSLALGDSLRRGANKIDSAVGTDVFLEIDEIGRKVLVNRIRIAELVSDSIIADIEEQIEKGFARGALTQAATDTLALARALSLRGNIDTALAIIASTADRLGADADAPRLYVQASDLASRNRQCGLAEEMWRQAQLIDSSLGDYAAWPGCRNFADDPTLSTTRDVSGLVNEPNVTGCINNHRNSTDARRSTASAAVQRAQCMVRESAFMDVEDAVALLRDARGLASADIVLQAETYSTAGARYGRDGRFLDAMAAYQAAAEHMLTGDSNDVATSITPFGGSASLAQLVAPVAPHWQAASFYRSAAAQAASAGVPVRQALMLELAGESLRELALDLQRSAGYSDENFDSLRDTLLESARNDLHSAGRIYRDKVLDFDRAADIFLRALELDTEIMPILTRRGQTSQGLFALSAFQDVLEDSPEGAVDVQDLLSEAHLVAISFAAKPEALQLNVARQARRFYAALARVAVERIEDHFLAEEFYGLAGEAVLRPIGLETNDWNTARSEFNNAGRQAEEYGSCERAMEWYEKAAETQHQTNPSAKPLTCSREALKYGEGVPLSIVEDLGTLGEVIAGSDPSGTSPAATTGSVRATPTRASGGSGSTQPTSTPANGLSIEDAIIEELSPPSEGSGSCGASPDDRVSAGHIGLLAAPLGLMALRLWRRRNDASTADDSDGDRR